MDNEQYRNMGNEYEQGPEKVTDNCPEQPRKYLFNIEIETYNGKGLAVWCCAQEEVGSIFFLVCRSGEKEEKFMCVGDILMEAEETNSVEEKTKAN